jgi:hypothetical protein
MQRVELMNPTEVFREAGHPPVAFWDAVYTPRIATTTSFSIRKASGFFEFRPGRDGAPLPEFLRGSRGSLVTVRLEPDGVLVLIDGDCRFVLGRCPGAVDYHGYTPEIYPDPGDTTTMTLDRGLASWPTPFHFACCGSLGGGGSWYPWRRYLYWHLSWTKAGGARLGVFVCFLQNYESVSGWNDPGAASLLRLAIRSAPAR